VEEGITEFGSDKWIPKLSELCIDVLKNLQNRSGGQFLRLRDAYVGTIEKPGIIIKEYHSSAALLKQQIFRGNAPNSHLDHHKIAALYIRSFLKHQPFVLDIPAETENKDRCLNTVLSNEYFSIAYLATIFKAWNKKFDWTLQMEARYKFDLIKLLYRYRKNIDLLDPLALSNIICLIEKHYFKTP
jgi:hypothetical protein